MSDMLVSDIKSQETQQVKMQDSRVSDVVCAAEGLTTPVENSPWYAPPPGASIETVPQGNYPPQMGFNSDLVGAPPPVSDVDLTSPSGCGNSAAVVEEVSQLASFPPASFDQGFSGAGVAPDIAPQIPPTVATPPANSAPPHEPSQLHSPHSGASSFPPMSLLGAVSLPPMVGGNE